MLARGGTIVNDNKSVANAKRPRVPGFFLEQSRAFEDFSIERGSDGA
jgi:hypothetical protein